MGFIPSSSTVTVRAYLTDAGKAKLYNSIESSNEPFATKFALGDSDANYEAVAAGFGAPSAGYIPEGSSFSPDIKSFILAEGRYLPHTPNIKFDGTYQAEHYRKLSVIAGQQQQLRLELRTAWPLGTPYDENYLVSVQPPDSIVSQKSTTDFLRLEILSGGVVSTDRTMVITFLSTVTSADLGILFGTNTLKNACATFAIKVIGQTSGAVSILYLDLVQG